MAEVPSEAMGVSIDLQVKWGVSLSEEEGSAILKSLDEVDCDDEFKASCHKIVLRVFGLKEVGLFVSFDKLSEVCAKLTALQKRISVINKS